MRLSFLNRTVLVTGGGGGLGKAYALEFAKRGANVVINDLGGNLDGSSATGNLSETAASNVVKEITSQGGKAVADYHNVATQGDKIVETALKAYGKIDVLVNNAGILRDKTFHKMEQKDWDDVLAVHLNGTFSLCRAVWPHMQASNFGRIINIGSGAGLYGNYGQSSYAAAKMGILGLTLTLSKEGVRNNIKCNCIVPIAGSRMTATVLPPAVLDLLHPSHVAPIVAALAHESSTSTGKIFEVGGGWYSEVRISRTRGVGLGGGAGAASAEDILQNMDKIGDFSHSCWPEGPGDALKDMMAAAADAQSSPSPAQAQAQAHVQAPILTPAEVTPPPQAASLFSSLTSYITSSPQNTAAFKALIKSYIVHFVVAHDADPQSKATWALYGGGSNSVPSITLLPSSAASAMPSASSPSQAPACTIHVSDTTIARLASRSLSTEMAFMRGLLKVEGSMGVALKMKEVLALAGSAK